MTTDFDSDSFTTVAQHVSDWVPLPLVPERIEVTMPMRAEEWFADMVVSK